MDYVTRRTHRMQKHMFGVTYLGTLILENILVNKSMKSVLRPKCAGINYVTHRSHQVQNHKLGLTWPDALFIETARAHPSIKNSLSMFHTQDAPECST
jgi:hypothetical protein